MPVSLPLLSVIQCNNSVLYKFCMSNELSLKPKSRNLLSFLAHKPEFYLVIVDFSQKYARLYALCDTLFMSTWLAFYSAQYYLCHFGHELERPAAVLI